MLGLTKSIAKNILRVLFAGFGLKPACALVLVVDLLLRAGRLLALVLSLALGFDFGLECIFVFG